MIQHPGSQPARLIAVPTELGTYVAFDQVSLIHLFSTGY